MAQGTDDDFSFDNFDEDDEEEVSDHNPATSGVGMNTQPATRLSPVVPPPAVSGGFKLLPEDSEVLRHYLEEFQDATSPTRKDLVERVVNKIYQTRPHTEKVDKVVARIKVRKWFYNHCKLATRPFMKFVRRWSARLVFYQENYERIMVLAEELSGEPRGSRAFLASLQDATTRLLNECTDDELEELQTRAEEWSEVSPPPEVQHRMAEKVRHRIIRDFQDQIYRFCGIRTFVLIAFKGEDNRVRTSAEEWNTYTKGDNFTRYYPNWRQVTLWDSWNKYAKEAFLGGLCQ
ncbi:hypothetical protein BC834DRAFT_916096 [Gloeopeniophorella convolvens]|nr:hypothetical protein BC834DRAFT_916096 [Gloeopeniophorella convolvens]